MPMTNFPPLLPKGGEFLRSREREKVAAGRMRVVGFRTNLAAGVRRLMIFKLKSPNSSSLPGWPAEGVAAVAFVSLSKV
jgi:hypothetical protein